MKGLLFTLLLVVGLPLAHAYENTLQFSPANGARGLTVAGYSYSGETIFGDCSYFISTASGGRGGRTIITHHYNECTWDLYGNLKSTVPVAAEPKPPRVLSTSGYQVIYAIEGTSRTGFDKRGFGFVNTPTAHYSWETPNGGYSVIGDSDHVFSVLLTSDGDFPLIVDRADAETAVSGLQTATAGTAKVISSTCGKSLPVHASCSVLVSYDPTTIACTTSAYGFAYTILDLALVTDAESNPGFKRGFTIIGVPICGD